MSRELEADFPFYLACDSASSLALNLCPRAPSAYRRVACGPVMNCTFEMSSCSA